MTSSTSCSSSRLRRAAALTLLAVFVAQAGCASSREKAAAEWRLGGARPRVALLPPENLTGATLPSRELLAELELALARAGIDVVSGARIEEFLARHRFRYTGGVDQAMARAARGDLGVDGILITSVDLYVAGPPPGFGVNLRLVSADDEARLLWIDALSRRGDDSPGVLGLGIIQSFPKLRASVTRSLMRSLSRYASAGGTGSRCPGPRRFAPDVAFRSASLDAGQTYTVAVLPFVNRTRRRGAGEVVALELVRQLGADPAFDVLEPGVVREQLLRSRIVIEGGVSFEAARQIRGTLTADLVVTGTVRDYEDPGTGLPRATFSVVVLDGRTNELVWQSTSYSRGGEGVFFFDAGTIHTAPALVCRMARGVADGMASGGGVRRVRGDRPGSADDLDEQVVAQ